MYVMFLWTTVVFLWTTVSQTEKGSWWPLCLGSVPAGVIRISDTSGSDICANLGRCEGGPTFHGSRSSKEIRIQNASCQMGGREVTGRLNCFFLQENEWSRSYKEINQHPSPRDRLATLAD